MTFFVYSISVLVQFNQVMSVDVSISEWLYAERRLRFCVLQCFQNQVLQFVWAVLKLLILNSGGSVGVVTVYRLEDRRIELCFHTGEQIFLFCQPSRPPQGTLSLRMKGYWGLFSWGKSERGVKLTAKLRLQPRLKMRGTPSYDSYVSWSGPKFSIQRHFHARGRLSLLVHFWKYCLTLGVCGGAVGWGTALQAGRSRVRFPTVSLEFLGELIGVDSASNRNEY